MKTRPVPSNNNWSLPPTPKQCSAIARLAQALGVTDPIEQDLSTRMEARNVMHNLRMQLKLRSKQERSQ